MKPGGPVTSHPSEQRLGSVLLSERANIRSARGGDDHSDGRRRWSERPGFSSYRCRHVPEAAAQTCSFAFSRACVLPSVAWCRGEEQRLTALYFVCAGL